MGDQPVTRPLHARRTTHKHNKHTQTSMLQAGFEPTIPVFEQPKIFHTLDRPASVIGSIYVKKNGVPLGRSVVL
jgi:hypothetical protein